MPDHVAILDPTLRLLPTIVSGRKNIESRWYVHRASPWDRIFAEDRVYFRNAGGPVEAAAVVERVVQVEVDSKAEIARLVRQYGGEPGICFPWSRAETVRRLSGKQYVILIFLKDTVAVMPFFVDKRGFGNACAWMAVGDIAQVRLP